MLIAICSDSKVVSGLIPATFKSAPYLLIIDTDQAKVIDILTKQDPENMNFADAIVSRDCEAVICGPIEEAAFDLMAGQGVSRYDGSKKKVSKAYTLFARDQLPLIRDHIGGKGAVGHSHDFSCDCGEEAMKEHTDAPSFEAVITAAGLSSRMGDFKPLMEIGGVKNIIREINTFLMAGVAKITVVTGSRAEDIRALLEETYADRLDDIAIVQNPDYASSDMFTSFSIGAKAVLEASDGTDQGRRGLFCTPVDSPLFSLYTLDLLMDRFAETSAQVCIPEVEGKYAHPVLFDAAALPLILEQDHSAGIRGILDSGILRIETVDTPDRPALLDADTPEEFALLLKAQEERVHPSDETCLALLNWAAVDEPIKLHVRAVADLAEKIAAACNKKGADLDAELIRAAALLHDILKGMDRHEERGGDFLTRLGMPKIGRIVALHRNMPEDMMDSVSEALVVYLADKLIQGSTQVTLQQRFDAKRERFANNPAALKGINKRQLAAEKALETIKKAGFDPEA